MTVYDRVWQWWRLDSCYPGALTGRESPPPGALVCQGSQVQQDQVSARSMTARQGCGCGGLSPLVTRGALTGRGSPPPGALVGQGIRVQKEQVSNMSMTAR